MVKHNVTQKAQKHYATCTLEWRHNGRDGVSNHQPHDCLLNRLFERRSKKTSKLRVTGLCAGNSLVTGEFPAQMASYAEKVSIWWRHHGKNLWHNRAMGRYNISIQICSRFVVLCLLLVICTMRIIVICLPIICRVASVTPRWSHYWPRAREEILTDTDKICLYLTIKNHNTAWRICIGLGQCCIYLNWD